MHEALNFRVGTRASRLARIQAREAVAFLTGLVPALACETSEFSSPGDRDRASDLRRSPGDFFTRDLDAALLAGTIDLAVHSAKDLWPETPAGIDWCWLPRRAEARDALVLAPGRAADGLPARPRIGISSERREAWCRARFPDAETPPIRGDVEARLAQVDAGDYDGAVMAAAALERLGLRDRVTEFIPHSELSVPPGQGYLALAFRDDDARARRLRALAVPAATFVGAGAGEAGSCTAAGLAALRRCRVCLYDALLDPALLTELPGDAEAVPVGKRAGRHAVPQEATTGLLLDATRRGRRTVRLKGGDPGLFGRLAEETAALAAHELPFRVIPGVSSLQAATTGTGMLLTRRGGHRGFCALTPRRAGGGRGPVDARTRSGLPIVAFMAVGALPELVAELRADGLAADTPAAVVFTAGGAEERVVRGDLAGFAAGVTVPDGAPGLVLVGEPARSAFPRDHGALRGRRVLVTAGADLQDRSAAAVRDHGGVPLRFPLIDLVPEPATDDLCAAIAAAEALVVGSPAAVRCLLAVLRAGGRDLRELPRILVAGPATARALEAYGLRPAAVPERDFGTRGLAALAATHLAPGQRVLRLRSDRAGSELTEDLARASGTAVTDLVLYRNRPTPVADLPACDDVLFCSASAVAVFAERYGPAGLAGRRAAAIGPPTARALAAHDLPCAGVAPRAAVEEAVGVLAGLETAAALTAGTDGPDRGSEVQP